MDNDVPPPSAVIGGVPKQFDELVLRATAREPGRSVCRREEMGSELDAIIDELGLPDFPYPRLATRRNICRRDIHRSRVGEQATTETVAPAAAAPAHPRAHPRP